MSAGTAGGGSKRVLSVEKTSEGEFKDYPDIDGNFVQPGSMSDGDLAEESADRLPPKTMTESALSHLYNDPERTARWKELFERAIKDTDGKSLPDIDGNFVQPKREESGLSEDGESVETPSMLVIDYLKLVGMKP